MTGEETSRLDNDGVEKTIALVGNPNSGKTTLFNLLTGMRQRVGNYPGVTVERKEGVTYTHHGKRVRIIDLPGSYSLNATSPDERILVDALLGRVVGLPLPNEIICCIDASNLERNLYLATQVLELGIPAILVLNMTDVAERKGIRIDTKKLSDELGIPVIPFEAHRGKGILELKVTLGNMRVPTTPPIAYPSVVKEAIQDIIPVIKRQSGKKPSFLEGEARLLLTSEGEPDAEVAASTRVKLWRERLDRTLPGWRSELVVLRYSMITDLMRKYVKRIDPNRTDITELVDKYMLHPIYGFGILGAVLTLLFYSIFSLATPFMDGIDFFITWVSGLAESVLPAGAIKDLIVEGVIGGVGGVLIFIPQILLLFFFISLLESSGYMARAAFILDRLMSKVGLHGKSFIPLLSSYACAVPGIMATRTIESPKDRLVTIMVAPFMSCSARLPVYLVMIAALLPAEGNHALKKAGILLSLYILGTVGALGFALLFRKTLIKGNQLSMVMELPPYRLPQPFSVFREMIDRAWIFLRRAGTVIFALSIILWFLMSYPHVPETEPSEVGSSLSIEMSERVQDPIEYSFAGRMGRFMEPVFEPLGYDWRITIGLIASFAAREVFVSTMAIVYRVDAEDESSLVDTLRTAQRDGGGNLFTPLTCLSVLVFFVFALQCVSTIAVVKRETRSWGWALFQFVYMFIVAWFFSFLVYQGGLQLGFS